jgi:hypothetical protein
MQAHHVALSSMADQKANILIGVNSVIFALVMREHAAMTPPLLILGAASLAAAVLCMIAVMPSIGGKGGRHMPVRPNLLFFGTFAWMTEDDFHRKLDDVLLTDAAIREAMIRDVHQLGVVLQHKKYRYLGWGYRVFVVGMVATLAAFAIERVF